MLNRKILLSNPLPIRNDDLTLGIRFDERYLAPRNNPALLYLGTLDEVLYVYRFLLEMMKYGYLNADDELKRKKRESNIALVAHQEWDPEKVEDFANAVARLDRGISLTNDDLGSSHLAPVREYLDLLRTNIGYTFEEATRLFSNEDFAERMSIILGIISAYFPGIVPTNNVPGHYLQEFVPSLPWVLAPIHIKSERGRGSYHPKPSDRSGPLPTFSANIIRNSPNGRVPAHTIAHEMVEMGARTIYNGVRNPNMQETKERMVYFVEKELVPFLYPDKSRREVEAMFPYLGLDSFTEKDRMLLSIISAAGKLSSMTPGFYGNVFQMILEERGGL